MLPHADNDTRYKWFALSATGLDAIELVVWVIMSSMFAITMLALAIGGVPVDRLSRLGPRGSPAEAILCTAR